MFPVITLVFMECWPEDEMKLYIINLKQKQKHRMQITLSGIQTKITVLYIKFLFTE